MVRVARFRAIRLCFRTLFGPKDQALPRLYRVCEASLPSCVRETAQRDPARKALQMIPGVQVQAIPGRQALRASITKAGPRNSNALGLSETPNLSQL